MSATMERVTGIAVPFTYMGRTEHRAVDGWRLRIADGIEVVTFRGAGGWNVREWHSRLSLGVRPQATRQAALEVTRQRVAYFGEARVAELIADWRRRNAAEPCGEVKT